MNKTPIMNCTPASPMPANLDQMGQVWYHHGSRPTTNNFGAKEGDQIPYKCPNCGTEFMCTRGPKLKFDKASVKERQDKMRELRARGYRPEVPNAS